MNIEAHVVQFVLTIIYSLLGLVFFGIGYLLFDKLTPFSVRKEIEHDQNTALAIIIGLVQGGIQSLSRSLYARIIPADKAAEFFGFYNVLGKFAAVIGPIMMGWVGVLTGNPRTSILSLLILFIGGGILLSTVNVKEGRRAAEALQDIRQEDPGPRP